MSAYDGNRMGTWRGVYLLAFYILIASVLCLGRSVCELEEGTKGGMLLGKEITPPDLFF